ncbi:MAG: hypothetical protein LBN21_03185, partial [Treponema sp.]|nr:hypothetical protein [Treponema sp.]
MATHEIPKINLENDTSPKREESLNSIKAYSGKVSEFLRDIHSGKELEWKNRTFEQTSQCLLTQVVNRILTIRDSVLIIHGPVGCAQGSYGYREIYRNVPIQLQRPNFELNIL